MSTYALVHGAGDDSWYWHLVVPRLEALGHDVVAPDLPCEDDTATFSEYADVVVEAVGDRDDVVVVAQSLGGYTGPLVCARRPVSLLVMLAAFTPRPGESCAEWFTNVGFEAAREAMRAEAGLPMEQDERETFFHDVPEEVTDAAYARGVRDQSGAPMDVPWPLAAWPDVPTRVLIGTNDRFFPAALQRRVVQERLGIAPDEIATGHLPALADPDGLVARLEAYRAEVAA